MTKNIMKVLLIIIGSIFVLIGFIGVLVPVMPTVPFLIVGAGCYIKSSKRCYNWLINHRLFGQDIKNFIEHRGVSRKSKISAIVLLGIAMGTSIIFIVPRIPKDFLAGLVGSPVVIQVVLSIITIGVMLYIAFFLKTIEPGKSQAQ